MEGGRQKLIRARASRDIADVVRTICPWVVILLLARVDRAAVRVPFVKEAQVVTNDYEGAWRVIVHDMDGDGDGDILSSAWEAKRFCWWENRDGSGSEWVGHDIAGKFDQPFGLCPGDVDGDGDIDVLVSACLWADIQWWENTDGKALAWKSHVVDTTLTGAYDVAGADIDNDGDIDVVGASWTEHELKWYENRDGKGQVWAKYLLARSLRRPSRVCPADMDGDGDPDVVATAQYDGDIAWWENRPENKSNWLRHTVEGSLAGACWVHVADIDGDNDADLVATGVSTDYIHWWENADGSGNNWVERKIISDFNSPSGVLTADADGDGDVDIIAASGQTNRVVLFENTDGKAREFRVHCITEDLKDGRWISLGDIDGDGDDDLVCASPDSDTIVFWKSTLAGKKK